MATSKRIGGQISRLAGSRIGSVGQICNLELLEPVRAAACSHRSNWISGSCQLALTGLIVVLPLTDEQGRRRLTRQPEERAGTHLDQTQAIQSSKVDNTKIGLDCPCWMLEFKDKQGN